MTKPAGSVRSHLREYCKLQKPFALPFPFFMLFCYILLRVAAVSMVTRPAPPAGQGQDETNAFGKNPRKRFYLFFYS